MKDPRGGAEHARDFFESFEFARTAVCLYSAGVAWRGAQIHALKNDDQTHLVGELSDTELRQALAPWFVDGRATIGVSRSLPLRIESQDGALSIELLTPATGPVHQPGLTLLWPACSNTPAIKEMLNVARGSGAGTALQLVGLLFKFAYQGLHLPQWAFDPVQVASADVSGVTMGLFWYRQQVGLWRQSLEWILGRQLEDHLKSLDADIRQVFVHWNQDWVPDNDGWIGVYEAFRQCGLELANFRAEYVALLRQAIPLGLGSRTALDEWNT